MKLSFGIFLAFLVTGNQCFSPRNYRRTVHSHELLYEDDQKMLSSLHNALTTSSKQTTDSSQQPEIAPFIVQLYQTLARNPRKLPFGAQFVRSFSSPKNKFASGSAVVKFRVRIPKDEKILFAMLHLCMKSNLFKGKPSLKVEDARSRMVVVRKGDIYKNGQCFKVPITAIIKKDTNTSTHEVNLILYVSILDQLSRLLRNSRIQRSRTDNIRPEVIVFSSSSKPKGSPLDYKLPSNSRPNMQSDFQPRNGHRWRADHAAKRGLTENINSAMTKKEGCYRKSLIVNFAGLGYKDIIAPTIFDAKQCIGVCKYPLGTMANPSQHSLIQQLLHSLYGTRVAKSTCCAAKRFVPLTTMIKDTYSGGYAIRSLEDMIVAECGCV
eukprot:Seg36.3 transcript_id=Seg36.3/GoldUCD/mRNA.D3Y31 product="Bone morphogenetic protein 10" protein_id=Seg36.3/GoldUCD/D3Y31